MTIRNADLKVGRFFAQVRRLVKKERFLMRGGYLEFAAGERPHM